MKVNCKRELRRSKQRIEHRLRDRVWCPQDKAMLSAKNIHYEMSSRDRAIAAGGIGAMQLLAQRLGLAKAIDENLHLLKVHLPYQESDHVLNLAFNALAGGTCIEDLELLRNSEGYLDCLGAQRIPDPTTAGDFCRRFETADVDTLQDVFNEVRLKVWQQQPKEFFEQAIIDADGTEVPENAWQRFERPAPYEVKTEPRAARDNIKAAIVEEKDYLNYYLVKEDVAEFDYKPSACKKAYRMIALRKTITVERGQKLLYPETRYFFYITNQRDLTIAEVVAHANDRCDQENLNAHLKGGVRALRAPVDTLVSNWAYMVMTALAWSMKAWFALLLPTGGRWHERYCDEKRSLLRMEFRTFLNAVIRIPAQIVRSGRRIVFRLMAYNRWLPAFFRGVDGLRALRC